MSDDIETGDTKNTDTPDTGNIVDINRWRDFNDAEPQRSCPRTWCRSCWSLC